MPRISKTVLFLFFIVPIIGFSQSRREINKNWNLLETGSPEERIKSAGVLHDYYSGENIDSIKLIGEKLFNFAIDNNSYSCLEESKIILSVSMMFDQKYIESLQILKSVLKKTEKRNDNIQSSRICRNISQIFIFLNDGKSALMWSKKAHFYLKNQKDKYLISKVEILTAESLLILNEEKKAITIFNRLIKYYTNNNKNRRLEIVYQILGKYYLSSNNLKKSEIYFKKANTISVKLKLSLPLSHSLNNLAIIDFEKGNYKEAKEKFLKALDLRIKSNYSKAISESYYNLGDFYFYQDDLENARKWYLKSEEFSREKNLITEQIDALQALTQISKSTKDYEEACLLFDEILIAQKKQIDLKSKIDDDWAEINRQIIISENNEEIFNKSNQYKPILEWILISILGVFVVFLSLRKRKTNLNAPEKSSES
ncbi:MAG: tetratricopeptide repeat protein [Fluviicola sp.]